MILEARYRAALRFYPESWRLENEEAVVGTLLDRAEGEARTRPRSLELMNLALHGTLSRLRRLPATVPPSVRDRTSTAALAVGAAIALTATMQLESSPSPYAEIYSTFGPFASPAIAVYAAWVVAFFASMAGFTAVARGVAVATIPLSVAVRAVADTSGMVLRPTWSFLGLLILLAVLVGAGRPVPDRASTRWLLAWFLPAIVVFTLPQTLHRGAPGFQEPLWLDRPQPISWALMIALLLAVVLYSARRKAWAAAVLLLGTPFAAVLVGRGASIEVVWLALLATGAALVLVVLLRLFGFRVRLVRVPPRR